jgi:hypothetical protein
MSVHPASLPLTQLSAKIAGLAVTEDFLDKSKLPSFVSQVTQEAVRSSKERALKQLNNSISMDSEHGYAPVHKLRNALTNDNIVLTAIATCLLLSIGSAMLELVAMSTGIDQLAPLFCVGQSFAGVLVMFVIERLSNSDLSDRLRWYKRLIAYLTAAVIFISGIIIVVSLYSQSTSVVAMCIASSVSLSVDIIIARSSVHKNYPILVPACFILVSLIFNFFAIATILGGLVMYSLGVSFAAGILSCIIKFYWYIVYAHSKSNKMNK